MASGEGGLINDAIIQATDMLDKNSANWRVWECVECNYHIFILALFSKGNSIFDVALGA